MLILLQQIRMRGDTVVDQRDVELQANTVHIGSDKSQDLQLFGAEVGAEHCIVTPQADGKLRVDCHGQHQITVGNSDLARATVEPGEWVRIGTHQFTAAQAPPGFDVSIEVRIDADAAQSIAERLRPELELRLPRLRPISYLLVLLVLLFGLIIPLLSYYYEGTEETIRNLGMPTDEFWTTGPLTRAHHLPGIADNCNACHVEPFQRVRNGACLDCHTETPEHLPTEHPQMAEFDESCHACHKEHNEPPTLVVTDKRLCTDCHEAQKQRLVEAAPAVEGTPVGSAPDHIAPVHAFTTEGHPQFLASLLRSSRRGWAVERERLQTPDLQESSHLKFPHDTHLDADKVSLLDGLGNTDRALECTDCHTLQRDGEHFRPVTMESTCRACHSLAFDEEIPGRELPHGEPQLVRTYLEEFYIKQAAEQKNGPEAPAPRRMVPGRDAEADKCAKGPVVCGKEKAAAEMDRLLTRTGCVSCHEVHQEGDAWRVQPVKLVSDWFPLARFDHVPHLNPGARKDRKTCLGCHDAQTSSKSEDILMPALDNCTACHGENRHADQSVELQCVACHAFHRPGLSFMGKQP